MTSRTEANICPSRTAPKFVIRVCQDLNEAIAKLANQHNRSANSEMVQAIEAWQSCKGQLELLKSTLSGSLDPAVAIAALSKPYLVPCLPETKFVVRLLPGMREKISEEKAERFAAYERNSVSNRYAMNDIVNDILQWWLNINQDLKALFAACNKKNKKSGQKALDVSIFMTHAA
ncbi:Arc family DNA-binding protein (plasmid) [Pseudomonas silesiensis]|uniref:Arc family DNA-binding protein n=1 Tax=Pseudomonas silesiensis TaxID=1853130 RepID=UPI0030D5F87B